MEKKEQQSYSLATVDAILSGLKENILVGANITIVGSTALKLQGFDVEIHDIDIEVVESTMSEKSKIMMTALSLGTTRPDDYNSSNGKRVDFKMHGIPVNVFIVSVPRCTSLWYNHMSVATVTSVIAYKKGYKRPKDYQVINDIVKQILS